MIPLRATSLKYSGEWPRYIIIHHTGEFYPDNAKFKFDTSRFQTGDYHEYDYKVSKNLGTRYHFIVEQVANDFQIVVSQPLLSICEFEDLDKIYRKSVHIGLLGNYDLDLPPNRLYRVLAFRLLSPLMRLFYLKESDILFHSAISNGKTTCPGEFIEKDKLLNQLKSVKRKQSLKRR